MSHIKISGNTPHTSANTSHLRNFLTYWFMLSLLFISLGAIILTMQHHLWGPLQLWSTWLLQQTHATFGMAMLLQSNLIALATFVSLGVIILISELYNKSSKLSTISSTPPVKINKLNSADQTPVAQTHLTPQTANLSTVTGKATSQKNLQNGANHNFSVNELNLSKVQQSIKPFLTLPQTTPHATTQHLPIKNQILTVEDHFIRLSLYYTYAWLLEQRKYMPNTTILSQEATALLVMSISTHDFKLFIRENKETIIQLEQKFWTSSDLYVADERFLIAAARKYITETVIPDFNQQTQENVYLDADTEKTLIRLTSFYINQITQLSSKKSSTFEHPSNHRQLNLNSS